jgi:hypothetical protein
VPTQVAALLAEAEVLLRQVQPPPALLQVHIDSSLGSSCGYKVYGESTTAPAHGLQQREGGEQQGNKSGAAQAALAAVKVTTATGVQNGSRTCVSIPNNKGNDQAAHVHDGNTAVAGTLMLS